MLEDCNQEVIEITPCDYRLLIIVPKLSNGSAADFNYTFPLGIAYVSSYLKRYNYNVDVVNLNHIQGEPVEALQSNGNALDSYQVILTGGMEAHYLQIKSLIGHIRKTSEAKVIVGGPVLNGDPITTFKHLGANLGIIGEGEVAVLQLVDALRLNKSFVDLPSVIGWKHGEVFVNQRLPQISNLDLLPYPDYQAFGYDEYLDKTNCNAIFYSGVFDHPRIYMVLGSRGCPYHCSFCTHTIGDKYVTRSMDSIFIELAENIQKYKINIVNVADDLLGNDRERIVEFCFRFAKLRKTINWECVWWANLTAKLVDEDLVQTLIESGCFLVGIGYESYSETVLRSMHKPLKLTQIDHSFDLLYDKKISLGANFIIGDFAENKDTFKATMKFVKERGKGQINLLGIIPSLGTEIYNKFIKIGAIKNQVQYLENQSEVYTDRAIFMTIKPPEISWFEHYLMLREMTLARYKHYPIAKVTLESNANEHYSISFTCPVCNESQTYNNILVHSTFFFFYFGYCRACRKRVLFLSKPFCRFLPILTYIYDLWFLFKKTTFTISKIKNAISRKLLSC